MASLNKAEHAFSRPRPRRPLAVAAPRRGAAPYQYQQMHARAAGVSESGEHQLSRNLVEKVRHACADA
eukprot:6182914-Pleurochrysis_carterae.AAC.2